MAVLCRMALWRAAIRRRFVPWLGAALLLTLFPTFSPSASVRADEPAAGYWLVASDGGIFAFGDANFHGSTGDIPLNQPIVGLAASPSGAGYWLVASDGGIFAFGDAAFHGTPAEQAPQPSGQVASMVATATGRGYWLVTSPGEVYAFGDATQLGAPASVNQDVVGMAPVPSRGDLNGGTRSELLPSAPSQAPTTPQTSTTAPPTTTTAPAPEPPPERFSEEPNLTWGTATADKGDHRAGKVWNIVEAGDHVYLAGEFTGVVPPGVKAGSDEGLLRKPYLVRMDIATGDLDASWSPNPGDFARALAASPDGRRLYVGGSFKQIDGQAARHLAAFDLGTGRLDPNFRAPHLNAGVRALAASPDGRTLFVAGGFTSAEVPAGQPNAGSHDRPLLAALDATTGALLDWEGPSKRSGEYIDKGQKTSSSGDGAVYALAITRDGGRLYAGGTFRNWDGADGVISIDAATGEATDWQPNERGCSTGKSTCRPFYGISLHPDDPDSFYATGDGFGGVVISFTYGKSKKGNWQVRTDGGGHAVVATSKVVYIGGHWDCVGTSTCGDGDKEQRKHLAALDPENGKLLREWTATANTKTGPYTGYRGAQHLYIGGEFSRINGRPQPGIVQFPAT